MALEIGNPAPLFSTTNHLGEMVRLEDFKGKKVALFFYPKDNTPGCTKEVCNLRDNYTALTQAGFVLLGISKGSQSSHQSFAEKHQLPFPLLMDEEGKIAEMYGAWGEKNSYGKKSMGLFRYTFVIDEQGLLTKIFKKVKTDDHASQILSYT